MTIALVTGVSGQDGFYLAQRLLAEGLRVVGVDRNPASGHGVGMPEGLQIEAGDLTDSARMNAILDSVQPDVVFNLAGLSSVARSWEDPHLAAEVSGLAAVMLMQHCYELQERLGKPVRFVQASSAEIFGQPAQTPQTEDTPIAPINPYGAAKAFAHLSARVYRGRGLHCSSLILYNHESPLRPTTFVTRKITQGVAAIAAGQQSELRLGNLDAVRDWGWAPDVVDAMVRAAQSPTADDYVIATGTGHTVREFVEAAFAAAGIRDWEQHVTIDPAFFRPVDATETIGDASKALRQLGWHPTVTFDEIVTAMVRHDLDLLGVEDSTVGDRT